MSVMDWYNIGYQTGPTAGLGQAIRGILDLHTKLSQGAGEAVIKEQMPSQQADTRLKNAQAGWYSSMGGSGEWTMNPITGIPERTLSGGKGGGKIEAFDVNRDAAMKAWQGDSNRPIPTTLSPKSEVDEFNRFLQSYQEAMVSGKISGGVEKKPGLGLGGAIGGFMDRFSPVAGMGRLAGSLSAQPQNILGPKVLNRFQTPVTTQPTQIAGQQMGAPSFNSPQEADNSGLPVGTVVLVGGRKYQI